MFSTTVHRSLPYIVLCTVMYMLYRNTNASVMKLLIVAAIACVVTESNHFIKGDQKKLKALYTACVPIMIGAVFMLGSNTSEGFTLASVGGVVCDANSGLSSDNSADTLSAAPIDGGSCPYTVGIQHEAGVSNMGSPHPYCDGGK